MKLRKDKIEEKIILLFPIITVIGSILGLFYYNDPLFFIPIFFGTISFYFTILGRGGTEWKEKKLYN